MQQRAGRQQRQCSTAGTRCPIQLRTPRTQHQRFDQWMTADTKSDALCTIQIPRQQGIELHARMGEISTETLHCTLTTPAATGPDLSSWLSGIHEEHKPLTLRPMWQKQSHSIGLIKPSQIPEITVLAERPFRIRVVRHQGRRWNHCSGAAQFSHEPLAAIRKQLSIKNRGEISHGRDRAPEKRQDGSQSARA